MADQIVNPVAHQRLIAKRAQQKQQIGELQASLTAAQQRIRELEQERDEAIGAMEIEADYRRAAWKTRQLLKDRASVAERVRAEAESQLSSLKETLAEREQELDDVRRDRMGSSRASRPEVKR